METFDVVIVGSGSAGGILVDRLSASGDLRILLLEAGLTDRHWTTRIPAASRYTYSGGPRNWCFETEPEPHMAGRRIFQPRGKVIGGSSSLNGMVFVRGHPKDYARWVDAGAQGWGWDDVLPAFKSLETCLRGANADRGGDGPIRITRHDGMHPIEEAFLEAGEQAGFPRAHDYNTTDQEGVTPFDANFADGWRFGTAAACVRPAMSRPNVTVRIQAHVVRVDVENDRAVGVTYHHRGRDLSVRAERSVVVCAGAFQSPQLLMLSGIGPADALRKHGIPIVADLPGVGAGLQDHLEIHVKHRCGKGLSKNYLMSPYRQMLAGMQWILFKSGPAAISHSRVGAFLRSHEDAESPDLQFHFWPYFLEGWAPPPDKDGYCFDVGPLRSQSRGSVELRSADPFDTPVIRLNGLSFEQDLIDFRRGIRIAREIARQPAFDSVRGPEVFPGPDVASDADIDSVVRAHANSAYHPCGTCRIGAIDDCGAVVDPRLRVRGIDGLRVVDASVIPLITAGNINAPTIMIGERAAAFMVEDLLP